MTARIGRVERVTSESSIIVEINLDGTGTTDISMGVPFYDHMLTDLVNTVPLISLSRHMVM